MKGKIIEDTVNTVYGITKISSWKLKQLYKLLQNAAQREYNNKAIQKYCTNN